MKKQNHLVFVRKKTNAEVCTPGGKEKATKVHASTSICRVAKAENMSRWTVQNLYGYHLRIDRMKIQFVQMLLPNNFNTRHWFPQQFLARREVDTECPPVSSGQMKQTFIWPSFGRFPEYSQLQNLYTRKFVFNLTGSVAVTKSKGVV